MAKFYLDEDRKILPKEVERSMGMVRVETGTGKIVSIARQEGRRNWRIQFEATHARLNKPVNALYDTQAELFQKLTEAGRLVEGVEVRYRIEVKRYSYDDVDQEKPIESIPQDHRCRDLVYLGDPAKPDPYGEPNRSASPTATPPPPPNSPSRAESSERSQVDSAPQTPQGSTMTRPAPQQQRRRTVEVCDHGVPVAEQCPQCLGLVRPLAQVPFNEQPPPPPEPEPTVRIPNAPHAVAAPAVAPPARRRVRIEEAKPWVVHNTDGSLNLGSYAFEASNGFTQLAYELISKHNQEIQANEGGQLPAVDPARVKSIAKRLLLIADRTQAGVRADGHHDRMDSSHTRARGAVRTALRQNPIPFGVSGPAVSEWLEQMVTESTALLRIALELHGDEYPNSEVL